MIATVERRSSVLINQRRRSIVTINLRSSSVSFKPVSSSSDSKLPQLIKVGVLIPSLFLVFSLLLDHPFTKFTIAQYKQNVGGRVIPEDEYTRNNVVTKDDIDSLLSLNMEYKLSREQIEAYERDGFVVLPNFLNASQTQPLVDVLSYNLDEMAFPDMLTSCSRKFHGEYYHSSLTWRFWQQPRFSSMLSRLALDGETPYMITSEILEMQNGKGSCIPQWHWDFLTFPQSYNASYKTGTQIWTSTELVNAEYGGGLAFMPGSHKWAEHGHPCFIHNLFEPLTEQCIGLMEKQMVIPALGPCDIVVFSRFTLHRSVARKPEYPFPSGRRLGYTLRIGSGASTYKKDTMSCFPSHPTTNFEGQLQDGERYDSIKLPPSDPHQISLPSDAAVYRPMNHMDSEDTILQKHHGMSMSKFVWYSLQATFRQQIHYKLFSTVEKVTNTVSGRDGLVDISCKASPPVDPTS